MRIGIFLCILFFLTSLLGKSQEWRPINDSLEKNLKNYKFFKAYTDALDLKKAISRSRHLSVKDSVIAFKNIGEAYLNNYRIDSAILFLETAQKKPSQMKLLLLLQK